MGFFTIRIKDLNTAYLPEDAEVFIELGTQWIPLKCVEFDSTNKVLKITPHPAYLDLFRIINPYKRWWQFWK